MRGSFHNIDELFKEGLSNFEHPVGDDVWIGIQKSLQKPVLQTGRAPRSKPVLKNIFISHAGITIMSVIVIIGSIYLFNNIENTIAIKKQPPHVHAAGSQKQLNKKSVPNQLIHQNTQPVSRENNELKDLSFNEKQKTDVDNKHETKHENTQKIIAQNIEQHDNNITAFDSLHDFVKTENQNITEAEAKNFIKITSEKPSAVIEASPKAGYAPLSVSFSNFGYAKSVRWNLGDESQSKELSPVHTYNTPGKYKITLMAINSIGETDIDTMTIVVMGGSSISSIPNIFSPNQDGYNDRFIIRSEMLESISVYIFDRAGHIVYNWNTINGYWDGRKNTGEFAPEGTYYYVINATGKDGKQYERKGVLTLIQ